MVLLLVSCHGSLLRACIRYEHPSLSTPALCRRLAALSSVTLIGQCVFGSQAAVNAGEDFSPNDSLEDSELEEEAQTPTKQVCGHGQAVWLRGPTNTSSAEALPCDQHDCNPAAIMKARESLVPQQSPPAAESP